MKDILCDHCEINELFTDLEKERGICTSCSRRQTISRTHNVPYIKFKDLPQSEKDRLNRQRLNNNNSAKVRAAKTKVKKEEPKMIKRRSSYSQDLHTLVKSLSHLTVNEMLIEIKKQFPEYDYFTDSILRSFLGKNKYEFKSSRGNNETIIDTTINALTGKLETTVRNRKNLIYTSDMINFLINISNERMTAGDLREALIKEYPEKANVITPGNFANILSRHTDITYNKGQRGKSNNNVIIKSTITDYDNDIEYEDVKYPSTEELINDDIEFENKFQILIKELTSTQKAAEDEEQAIEERLKPIYEEVDAVLKAKYKDLGCDFEVPYTTEDYIKAFEILKFIMDNKFNILNNGKRQHMITDAYERDINHACENTVSAPGDTYLQDKLHVLRKRRRQLEYMGKDVSMMRQFCDNPSYFSIKNTLSGLKYLQQVRADIGYIPYVDATMIGKYDWCIEGVKPINGFAPLHVEDDEKVFDDYSEEEIAEKARSEQALLKHQATLVTRAETLNKQTRGPVLNTYRVSCQISGGGYGAFSHWHKDYKAINEDIAKSYGDQELSEMKKKNPGILIQNVDIHKIN